MMSIKKKVKLTNINQKLNYLPSGILSHLANGVDKKILRTLFLDVHLYTKKFDESTCHKTENAIIQYKRPKFPASTVFSSLTKNYKLIKWSSFQALSLMVTSYIPVFTARLKTFGYRPFEQIQCKR